MRRHFTLMSLRTTPSAIYGKAYDGSLGLVHGGAVTASFADVLACAQALHAAQAHIGTVTVRFRAPIPVGQRVEYEAWLDRVDGRKSFVPVALQMQGATGELRVGADEGCAGRGG